ncbi:hypothetical protein AJ79_09214 [Helicocarpus griseus UAMH5409]|uniref:Carrier domain-containing protein n=1 Tax=Helicocarpus griseus UAMH5409 TaxID=1447875 RepID=A0A2B7WLB3_9EURO|nr:hypothetical protein AJ79_09214 [Helicocarpus griseus UAMH5409]
MNGNHVSAPLDTTVVDLFDDWAAKAPRRIAAEWQRETLTYAGLRNASLHVSRALLSAGVPPRAKVPLLTDMSLEMLPAIIGILRVGACYAPMDMAAWSQSRIEAALSNLSSPVAVVTTPCPGLQLPVITVNFQKEWLHSPLGNSDDLCVQLNARRNGLRDDDLIWILFTSGTTGKPKGVMVYHSAACAYSTVELMERGNGLPTAAEDGARNLLAFSVGFDGCASVIWSTLTQGNTLAMASPSNFPEVATTCDALMLTPSMLAILDPSGPYDCVRYIYLGAEDPSPEVVRQWTRPNRKMFTTYGPTEATCIITLGELEPDEKITLGHLIPGVRVVLVDENLQECNYGELLIAGPLAAGYINNTELTAKKFIQWNGERFYRTGDLVRKTENGQLVWAGRADSLVKNRGFLVNLESEVEPALLSFPPVRLAVALKWRDKVLGYVQPATVDVEELREFMKKRFDAFVVPDEILALESFPLNFNGKVDRHALKAEREKMVTREDESFLHDGHVLAYDALRLAFSKCLHVAFRELNKSSSFTRLGGNSMTAIRFSNFLKKHGYPLSTIQILRLDTIELLEKTLKSLSNSDGPKQDDNDSGYDSEEVPATPAQRVFLTRSLKNPIECALIGITEYVGDPLATPTAGELHDAFVKALSAHSIFQTRFDLTNFTLSNLDRLNLDWHAVSVDEAEFENACVAAEEKAWLDLNELTRSDNEVPYFHITCVSVPDRKALAFVTRAHHVLVDVVTQSIISQDVDRALAGEEVPRGPRIKDFARFMHKYEQDNLERAISTFENMVKLLPATSVLQLPSPQTPLPSLGQAFDLIRLDSPVSIRKSALDASAHDHRITASSMIYAAWALFLSSITAWDRVGFRVSLSGRTVSWPLVQSTVGAIVDSTPFSTAVPRHATVNEWLVQVHQTTLDVLEFDGLAFSLPDSLRADPRTCTTNVLCFLDVPEASTPNWSYREKQRHNYLMDWYIAQDGEGVATMFEIQPRHVDLDWAKEMAGVPGRMLEGLVNATKETLVRDLLR